MKSIRILFILVLSIHILQTNAQEKKIKFNKGTLKICSSKTIQIEGYDGDEIIIKSLHPKRNSLKTVNYDVSGLGIPGKPATKFNLEKVEEIRKTYVGVNVETLPKPKNNSIRLNGIAFYNNDRNRKKGLKRLGKKNENSDLGIYFIIEQKDGELIFRDDTEGQLVILSNEQYEIKIPNSIKLNWQTNGCREKQKNKIKQSFFNTSISSLSNFDGEVEISTALNNMKLNDVTGPVSINSIGGNVTVEFDKKTPKKLYSIYSNNGFIDITLPASSNIKLDVTGRDIFSDIDFEVEEEKEENDLQQMGLKLNSGKVKMKLNANLGNIYLRKK